MKLESRSGALIVSERMSLPRWAALAAGTTIAVVLVATQLVPERIPAQTFIGGVLLALVAFAAAGFMPDREFEFDATGSRLAWCVWRLAYSRGGTVPFDEIRSVEVHADRGGEPRQGPPSFTVVLMTAAGPLELTTRREFDRVACERVASALRQRIGLSSVAPDAREAIAELVEDGRLPEAIALASRELGIGLAEARDYVDTLRESKAA